MRFQYRARSGRALLETREERKPHIVTRELFLHTVSLAMDAPLVVFEDLYDTYADAIFRHLYFRLGDRERAKELTQEVFVRTWQQLAAGVKIDYPKAFLFKVANNIFINEIRTDRRTASLDALADEVGFEAPDSSVDVGAEAERAEVLRFLASLPEQHRSVLTMRFIDGLQVKEIATLLEERETTISMRIVRAIAYLKERYQVSP